MNNTPNILDECSIKVPNRLDYIGIIQRFVSDVSAKFKLNKKSIQQIEVAVEEAVTNVIKYAFHQNNKDEYEIICQKELDRVVIRICDKGIPFDPAQLSEYNPDTPLSERTAAGLGSFLIRKMVDLYEYNNLGKNGKETVLIKYLSQERITDKKDHEPEVVDYKKSQKVLEFEIRRMQKHEAVEVVRCIFDSYGYSYANENIYYPERVAAMNESGKLLSAVAVTKEGEFGGHCALIFYDHLPTELGIAVTKKNSRGSGIAGRLAKFLDEEALATGHKGFQVKEVTVHPYTQKFCDKLGFSDCGFLLCHSPKTLSFKGIAEDMSFRNTDILGFKYFNKPQDRTVYSSSKHSEMIKKLYNNIGVDADVRCNVQDLIINEHSEIDAVINPARALMEIFITKYGKDTILLIKKELIRVKKEEIKTVELYINIFDKNTAHMISQFEKLGFIFTGILPETKFGDALVMQYFNGIIPEYDKIIVLSDISKEFLEYIKNNDPNFI